MLCVISSEFDPDRTGITRGMQAILRLRAEHGPFAVFSVPSDKEDMTVRSPGWQC